MTEESPDSKESSQKHSSVLSDRKSRIIRELEEIEKAPVFTAAESSNIYNLEEEYNLLVEEEDKEALRPWADPLEVLPPELWPAILPGTPRELLVLTLVCNRWCNAVISVPKLWSFVNLDGNCEDYLALAVACLAFSAPFEISLSVNLTLEAWKEIAPLIVVERGRINYLNISSFDDGFSLYQGFEIILDFGELPRMVAANLPGFYDEPPLLDGDLYRQGLPRGVYSGGDTLFTRAPLLTDIYGFMFTPEQLSMPAIARLQSVHVYNLGYGAIEGLARFPNLRSLHLVEEKEPIGTEKSLPRSLDRCLSSLESLDYHGLALNRTLRCIGSNILHIEAQYVSIPQLSEVLVSLQSFPRLSKLNLHIDRTSGEPFRNPSADIICLPSVTYLGLHFPIPFNSRRWDPNASDEDIKSEERNRDQARDDVFRCLIVMMPNVEELNLHGQGYSDAAVVYIQSLRKLRVLYFSTPDGDSPQLSLSSPQLEEVSWYGQMPSQGPFNILRSSTLRTLTLWPESKFMTFDQQTPAIDTQQTLLPRSRTLAIPLPNLRSLTVTVENHLNWDLNSFPKLESIELIGHPSLALAGDFFVELILQPDLCPCLEEVGIGGLFVEWDLLILMLERRNFIARPSTTRIKGVKLRHPIAYKLLHPLSNLLSGKFPHRDPITLFSSTAIGVLIWDPSTPGCEKCCRTFRKCATPVQPAQARPGYQSDMVYAGDSSLAKESPSLFESLPADPPLSPDVTKWLEWKAERRRRFAEGCKKARGEFHRAPACGHRWEYQPWLMIGQRSLSGLYFDD